MIDEYFTGTVSRIGGITLEDIEENVEKLHSEAFDPLGLATMTLNSVGSHKLRSQGEEHLYNPRLYIFSSSPQEQATMSFTKSILI